MKRNLVVDGNSLLFKAFFASLSRNMMKTSSNIPTNAIYTFCVMIFKVINDLQPDNVFIAFDSGKKSFRIEQYDQYKGNRHEVDPDLIAQFPLVFEMLDSANIAYLSIDHMEGDDIIGSFVKKFSDDENIILSSDRDLLQLVSDNTKVYLSKKGISEMVIVDQKELFNMYELTPCQFIELKALMGDSSDNIPGVKGIGEKTALKLLTTYHSLDSIYENVEEQSASVKNKLINGKEDAYLSKLLATIKTDIDFDYDFNKTTLNIDYEYLNKFYLKYEMKSLINNQSKSDEHIKVDYIFNDFNEKYFEKPTFIYLDVIEKKLGNIILVNDDYQVVCEYAYLESEFSFFQYLVSDKIKYTYDLKNMMHLITDSIDHIDDLMVVSFLCDTNNIDIQQLINKHQISLSLDYKDVITNKKDLSDESRFHCLVNLALELNRLYPMYYRELIEKEMLHLYTEIEKPLIKVLYNMENNGIRVDVDVLKDMEKKYDMLLNELTLQIYELADEQFNINSPKQLAVILFDKLQLKANKKRSTSVEELEKLLGDHQIIDYILKYRTYSKLQSTYIVGLQKYVGEDSKIHTTYQQCITQTGRLSSTEPNLQNISVRNSESKEIRKAFIPTLDYLLSCDYSQVELRILASLSNEQHMIDAFNQGIDIHQLTASKIFGIPFEEVTSEQRSKAKAVNFGIVYGMSDFGLANQVSINRIQAKKFIDLYLQTYPKISEYMNQQIAFCEENGYVKTLFNRQRVIPEIHNTNFMIREFGKRAAKNAPIQGSA
ncbi:MAG: DNA polymerase I, partial [Erysipelotrichaceae bacterium]